MVGTENPMNMDDDWGYPYSRKPPNIEVADIGEKKHLKINILEMSRSTSTMIDQCCLL